MFSILHITIRSLNKNFGKLHEYLSLLKRDFSVAALTETWCNDDRPTKNSSLQLPNCNPIHHIRNNDLGGGGMATYAYQS